MVPGAQRNRHWIDTAFDCGYITDEEARELNDQLSEIGRMLNGMIQKADLFCGPTTTEVGESEAQYFVNMPTERTSRIHE